MDFNEYFCVKPYLKALVEGMYPTVVSKWSCTPFGTPVFIQPNNEPMQGMIFEDMSHPPAATQCYGDRCRGYVHFVILATTSDPTADINLSGEYSLDDGK